MLTQLFFATISVEVKMENIETIKECDFLKFYNSRTYTANCFNEDGSLNKNYNSSKTTGVIATIFEDHWEQVYLNNKDLIDKYRPNAPQEIQKIIDCYNKNLGCSLYECPTCHDIVFVGHTCKSRFCSSCGYKYKNQRVESVMHSSLSKVELIFYLRLYEILFTLFLMNILRETRKVFSKNTLLKLNILLVSLLSFILLVEI